MRQPEDRSQLEEYFVHYYLWPQGHDEWVAWELLMPDNIDNLRRETRKRNVEHLITPEQMNDYREGVKEHRPDAYAASISGGGMNANSAFIEPLLQLPGTSEAFERTLISGGGMYAFIEPTWLQPPGTFESFERPFIQGPFVNENSTFILPYMNDDFYDYRKYL